MIDCYIALGSNLNDPLHQVSQAICHIAMIPDSQLLKQSPWYRSKALGPGSQPDYINGVCKLASSLPARALLEALQAIENKQGRVRSERWAARTLDLDILLYGDSTINTRELHIPHPRMDQRNFVLYPLYDIEPGLILPGQRKLSDIIQHCSASELEKL